MQQQPTHVAAICLLNMGDGKITPALTHILGEPGEGKEELVGRAVLASREKFPGFMIFDLNVATVGEELTFEEASAKEVLEP